MFRSLLISSSLLSSPLCGAGDLAVGVGVERVINVARTGSYRPTREGGNDDDDGGMECEEAECEGDTARSGC